jgi:hypothetical protein
VKHRGTIFLGIVLLLAILSRYYYCFEVYNYNFGFEDSYDYLIKALHFQQGILHSEAGGMWWQPLWSEPFFTPWLLAFSSTATGLPLEQVPFLITPLLTIIGIVLFYILIKKYVNSLVALFATLLLALHPFYSFASTEPEKAPYVVGFFMISLYLLYKGKEQKKFLYLSGLFLGLATLSHVAGLLFVPVIIVSYLLMFGYRRRDIFSKHFIGLLLITLFLFGNWFIFQSVYTGQVIAGIFQPYIDVAEYNVLHGFSAISGLDHINAIQNQLTPFIFYLSIGGIVLSLWRLIAKKEMQYAPFLLWLVFVTGGIALQYPSGSHLSRYTYYSIPVFLFFSAVFLSSAFNFVREQISRSGLKLLATSLIAVSLMVAAGNYMTTNASLTRYHYAPRPEMGIYLNESGILRDNKVLYEGWPSLVYCALSNGNFGSKENLVIYGIWGSLLDEPVDEFIRENQIRYFVYDHTRYGERKSDEIISMLKEAGIELQKQYETVSLTDSNRYVILYELIY